MLFRLSALKSQLGKGRVTPHPNPPPRGGRGRCGVREQLEKQSSPLSFVHLRDLRGK